MESPQSWWQTFFSGLVLEMRGMYSEAYTQGEADFIEAVLSPASGARILDVPCGTGRLALALAARGYNLVGIDLTAASLEEASSAARDRGLRATFQQGDMRNLPKEATFDHAFCFGNSFAYFDHEGNIDFLKAVHRALKPDGKFAMQTGLVAESVFPQPLGRRWYPLGDLYFLHDTRYSPNTGQLTSDYVFFKDGQMERKQAVYQVYSYRELRALFESVGFRDFEGYGSPKREPYQLGSPGLWLVARR